MLFEKSTKIEFPLASSWQLPKSFPFPRTNQLIIQDWFLLDTRDLAKGIAKSVNPDYFEFLQSKDESEIRAKMEDAKANVLKNALECLTSRYGHRFSPMEWENLLQGWILETNNYLNWLCTLESKTGQSLMVFDSVDSMTDLNRDAISLYAKWVLNGAPKAVKDQRVTLANRIMERLQQNEEESLANQE